MSSLLKRLKHKKQPGSPLSNLSHLVDEESNWDIGVMMRGHLSGISCLAFSSDGNRIVSGSRDGVLRIWDGLTGAGIRGPLEGHTGAITCASFLADNTRIVSGSDDGTLRLWNVATDEGVKANQERHTKWVNVVIFSPDGSRVLSGSNDGTLRLWNAETGATIGSAWKGHTKEIDCAAFLPDAVPVVPLWRRMSRVVSAASDDQLQLWDVATATRIGKSKTTHYDVHQLVFSPDGYKFISFDYNHSMQLWDTLFNPIGNPVEVGPSSHGHNYSITFLEDSLSFSMKSGRTFKISDEGVEEM
ncbi:WD40 repeat-like protein [Serendipita vermifera]|nr:WD40 repeat-like protein [Serendipita vermifera]